MVVEGGATRLEYAIVVEVTPEGASSRWAPQFATGAHLTFEVDASEAAAALGASVDEVGISRPDGSITFRDETPDDPFHGVTWPDVFSGCAVLAGCSRELRAWAELSNVPEPSARFAVSSAFSIGVEECPGGTQVDRSWVRIQVTRLDPPAADASVSMDGGI